MVDRQSLARASPLPEYSYRLAPANGFQPYTHRYRAQVPIPAAPQFVDTAGITHLLMELIFFDRHRLRLGPTKAIGTKHLKVAVPAYILLRSAETQYTQPMAQSLVIRALVAR